MENVVQSTHQFSIVSGKNETIASVAIEPMHGCFYLTSMWVHQDYRKQGLGTKVLKAALEVYGNKVLYLHVAPYTNRPMDAGALFRWYGTFGFAKSPTTPGIMIRQPFIAQEKR